MLDIKAIREDADTIKNRLSTRGGDAHLLIDEVLACDETRRKAETQKQELQSQRKQLSKQILIIIGRERCLVSLVKKTDSRVLDLYLWCLRLPEVI